MKKILLSIIALLSFFVIQNTYAWCTYTEWQSISNFLDACKPSSLVWDTTTTWYWVETWLRKTAINMLWNVSTIIWLFAVIMIAYAWMLMQFSSWDDSKVKKAKDLIKWNLIWIVVLISAWWIVYIVINLVYWLA